MNDIALKRLYEGKRSMLPRSYGATLSAYIGACGSITYGRARIGKTVCMNYVAESIRNQYGSREMVIIWNVTDHPETERNFYASILMAMGYECPRYSTALILIERVLNELILRAHESPFKKAVMFIDEAWKLREKDFYWLTDLIR